MTARFYIIKQPMLSWAERDDDVKMNLTLMDLPVVIGRYLLTLRVTDYLDIAIMAFVLYLRL